MDLLSGLEASLKIIFSENGLLVALNAMRFHLYPSISVEIFPTTGLLHMYEMFSLILLAYVFGAYP